MKRILLALAIALLAAAPAGAWGRAAHQIIARSAALSLPAEMQPFFLANREHLVAHAEDPDIWRETDPAESNRHYLDYDILTPQEQQKLTASLEETRQSIGRERLETAGILPWRIAEIQSQLASAFKNRQWSRVRELTPALAHYVADSYVPFHATQNYNGQLTGNNGIHGRFDIELVERYLASPLAPVTPAAPTTNPFAFALQSVKDSCNLVPACLKADDQARAAAPLDSEAYYLALYQGCGEIASRRMSQAAIAVAGYWSGAWIAAGKPELPPREAVLAIFALGADEFAALENRRRFAAAQTLALAAELSPYDALAARVVGPKKYWERSARFLLADDWSQPEANKLGATITPALAIAIPEAIEALHAFPNSRKRIVLFCDGAKNEKEFDPIALGDSLTKQQIILEVITIGQVNNDEPLQTLVKSASGAIKPLPTPR